MTLSIDIQHNSIECHYDECCYAVCRNYLNVMLIVVRLNFVMLSVVTPIKTTLTCGKCFSCTSGCFRSTSTRGIASSPSTRTLFRDGCCNSFFRLNKLELFKTLHSSLILTSKQAQAPYPVKSNWLTPAPEVYGAQVLPDLDNGLVSGLSLY